MPKRDRRPWPYSAGRRGVNRVRVYDRDDSGVIQVEWFDDLGRHQRSLKTVVGEPVTDRTLARDIADEMASAQAEKRNQAAKALVFGGGGPRTLKELLTKLHEFKAPQWAASHERDQKRFRKYWLEAIGGETPVIELHRIPIEAMIAKEAEKRGWAARTAQAYIRYLKDAVGFARKRLKWIDERFDLSHVDMPTPAKSGPAYSESETHALIDALYKVDLRGWLVAEAYYQAGRRVNATVNLKVKDVRFDEIDGDEVVVLSYPIETDKAKKKSEAVLVGEETVSRVRELLARPRVKLSGLLVPDGDLSKRGKASPVTYQVLKRIHTAAEEAAEIPHVKHRRYHAVKRRFGGLTADEREIAAWQSGTSVPTLRRYDPNDDIRAKAGLAKKLVGRRT